MASPTTPRFSHSRESSGFDFSHSPSERRQSRSSLAGPNDPGTPLRSGFNPGGEGDSIMFNTSGMGLGDADNGGGNGLGNLADELADALSDGEDEEYYDQSGAPGISVDTGDEDDSGRDYQSSDAQRQDGIRDSGVDVGSPDGGSGGGGRRAKHMSLTLPPAVNGRGHRRKASDYDGSEYGSESDLESPGMSATLVARMDAVESLARRGTENNGGHTDGVFRRVTDGLRDLAPQSTVEANTTRLITAHSALTTHLTHTTRQLQNLAFPLLNPLAVPPDPDTIDSLLPELTALQEMMPRPPQAALSSIMGLRDLTTDLAQTLSYLTDTLHMSRQTSTTAARKLRSAKELVAELRRDEELREEGEAWLSRGNWGERLERRECASVCGDIVGGFEEVCDGWRTRLAQAETSPA
ncbi:hypothetical protein KVR01_013156 [Diaporthe batatas]|uniref:uncharacterized protein n=1 Tax=Diaporthe batatas TaxID=748121 RepID=UPI001D05ACF2|nr:uncharacterized protein KVR01_013156 [Diaporthe batatas]KAG8156934.1 hypothetical protein KVR01_013156 [Diaporthe batatas]